MLERDKFESDPCTTHFPKATLEEYFVHIAGPFPFRHIFTDTSDFRKQAEFRQNIVAGAALLSLMPIIFHRKIYWFRNYSSVKARVLMGLCWLLIPANVLATYFQFETNREITVKF